MIKSIFTISFLLTTTLLVAQTIVHQELFGTGLGTWNQVSITDPTDIWSATAGYAEMNGFGGADDEDWLISPSIDLTTQVAEYFLFDYNDAFNGNMIEVLYSTNYNGGNTIADVQSATWTSLNAFPINIGSISCFSNLFQRHPAIDVSTINNANTHFAFRYTGTSTNSKRYYIDNVQILADYYASIPSGLDCCNLKTALHNLIRNQTDNIRYTSANYDVWDAILHTDTRLNDAGTNTIVWDMFTDFPTTTGEFEFDHCTSRDQGSCPGGEGQCYNREHTFPRSWWGGGTTISDSINTDLHHIVPSDRSLNTVKSNYPPGYVLTATTTGSNGFMVGSNNTYPCGASMRYYEPIDEYKGDYARMHFYVITRYEHNLSSWTPLSTQGNCALDGLACPGFEPWVLNVLLEWHFNDPVSQKEIDRNNAVYSIQGNRNPFIDNPSWVNLIWGDHLGNSCNAIPLPVELISFEGNVLDGYAELSWSTASEQNSDYFEIQKSKDGISWSAVSQIEAKGNSTNLNKYMFSDYNYSNDINYYRLKQVDFDGAHTYSSAIYLHQTSDIVYPNPASETIHVNHSCNQFCEYRIVDQLGRLIESSILDQKRNIIQTTNLKDGIYVLHTCSGSVIILVKKNTGF